MGGRGGGGRNGPPMMAPPFDNHYGRGPPMHYGGNFRGPPGRGGPPMGMGGPHYMDSGNVTTTQVIFYN